MNCGILFIFGSTMLIFLNGNLIILMIDNEGLSLKSLTLALKLFQSMKLPFHLQI